MISFTQNIKYIITSWPGKLPLYIKKINYCLFISLSLSEEYFTIFNNLVIKIISFLASNGVKVPAGATVVIATYKLHRHEEIYPNPDKFDPDNFLPERSANRHYYAFVPFSAGPRSCVGEYWNSFVLLLKLKNTIKCHFRDSTKLYILA